MKIKGIWKLFWRNPIAWVIYIYSFIVILMGIIYWNFDSLWFYFIILLICNIRIMYTNKFGIKKMQGELNGILADLQDKVAKKEAKKECIQH